MKTDIHAHAFHPKIADKVLAQLAGHYGIAPVGSGREEDLLAARDAAGLDRVVVHTAATAPAQVRPANDWAIRLQTRHAGVVAFGAMHPDHEDFEAELDLLRRRGVKGIKLHPDFQGFSLDDPRLFPLFEEAEDFVFMLHVGDEGPPETVASSPLKVAALLDRFPRVRFIAAHLGGYRQWDLALDCLLGRELWIDTSSSLAFVDDAKLKNIFAKHPREKILFGSDWPLYDPATELQHLQKRLGLSDGETEALTTNATALLGG